MRYGLIADIHEHVDFLRRALDRLRELRVDRIILLGDVFETGKRLSETARLLADAGAVGVWGNHDFGLCCEPHDDVRDRYGPDVMGYFATLRPTLESEDILFTHVAPWHDAEDILELWCFEDEEPSQSFHSNTHRLMLHGHHHRWKADRSDGPLPWDGGAPLALDPNHRYLIEVNAIVHGQCAVLDSTANTLFPIDLCSDADPALIRNFGP